MNLQLRDTLDIWKTKTREKQDNFAERLNKQLNKRELNDILFLFYLYKVIKFIKELTINQMTHNLSNLIVNFDAFY